VLDSLSRTIVDGPQDSEALAADSISILSPQAALQLHLGETDHFYGSFSGTQVETELRRLGTLVKGILRDLGSLKDSVWHLQDERFEVKQKVEEFERYGLGEVKADVAKTNTSLKALSQTVEILDARIVGVDDCSEMFGELACKLHLMEARLAACEEQDLNDFRPISVAGGEGCFDGKPMDVGAMWSRSSPPPDNLSSDGRASSELRKVSPDVGTLSSALTSPAMTPAMMEESMHKQQRGASVASTTASGGGHPLSGMPSRPATTMGRFTSEGAGTPSLDRDESFVRKQ
jgi:hypothetical protein